MPLPIRKRKLAALLLLTGLVFSAIVMLTMAEFHEEVGEPMLSRLDPIILQAIHVRDTPTLTRLAFTLTWIGSPAVLVPVVALAATLLWRAKLRRDAEKQPARALDRQLERNKAAAWCVRPANVRSGIQGP